MLRIMEIYDTIRVDTMYIQVYKFKMKPLKLFCNIKGSVYI